MPFEAKALSLSPQSDSAPRKPYSAPRLTVYGDVDRLTLNIVGVNSDVITGSRPAG